MHLAKPETSYDPIQFFKKLSNNNKPMSQDFKSIVVVITQRR